MKIYLISKSVEVNPKITQQNAVRQHYKRLRKRSGGDKLINLNGLPSAPTPDAERLQRDRENEMNDYFLRLAARDAALRKALAAFSNTGKGEKNTEKQEESTDKSTK